MNRYYMIPNNLFDYRLSSSAFALYVLLLNRFYFTDSVKIKLETLSKQTGFCVNTIQKAIRELHNKGLVTVRSRFKNGHRTTNEYFIKRLTGKFSRIDRKLFYFILNSQGKAALLVYCVVNHYANKSGRAFPSYNQISALTGLSRATCILKVRLLGESGTLAREHYICAAGDHGHNNYVTVSLTLRFFLFNIILYFYRKAKEKAARLHKLLKLQRCAGSGHTRGSINFDKHIKDPLEYVKIENNNLSYALSKISGILHRTLQKIRRKAKSSLAKLRSVFRS